MFDKSIVLNLKLASKEFGIGIMISVFSAFLMNLGGFLSILSAVGFLASLVLYTMGFIMLFHKSLFSNYAYLYMSLPISYLQVVLSKVFVGTFWLSLWISLLFFSLGLQLMPGENLLESIIGYLLIEGIPAESMGILILVLSWSYILGLALFSATMLFAIIFANTLRTQRFRIVTNFSIILLSFTVTGIISYAINKWLNLDSNDFSNILELSVFGLVFTMALTALFIFLSERLLNKKYNLS